MNESIIQGKPIKGFQYADGVHWYWGEKEVAVINEHLREIEWVDRTFKYPEEVIEKIRNKVPFPKGIWIIEARRTRSSTTQGNVSIFINNKDIGLHFEDKIELNDNGEWESTTPDEQLGKFVCAGLWHKLDDILHYSDKFKNIFYPDWKKEVK